MEALRQQSITSQGPSASGATPPRPGSTQALLQPQRELTIRPGGSILVAAPPVSNSAAVAAAIAAVSGSTTVPTTTTPAAPGHYPIVYGSSLILNPGNIDLFLTRVRGTASRAKLTIITSFLWTVIFLKYL